MKTSTTGNVIDAASGCEVIWTQRGFTAWFVLRNEDGVILRWQNASAGIGDAARMADEALASHLSVC